MNPKYLTILMLLCVSCSATKPGTVRAIWKTDDYVMDLRKKTTSDTYLVRFDVAVGCFLGEMKFHGSETEGGIVISNLRPSGDYDVGCDKFEGEFDYQVDGDLLTLCHEDQCTQLTKTSKVF